MLGAGAEACQAELADLPVEPCVHNEWRRGIGSTVAAAAAAAAVLPVNAMIVMACDQPRLEPRDLAALHAAWSLGTEPMAASLYDGVLGIPALFPRGHFPDLMQLEGDQGAATLLRARPRHVMQVPCPRAAFDVDTEADARRLGADS